MQTEIGFQALRDQDPVAGACLGLWADVLRVAVEDAAGAVRAVSLSDVRKELGVCGGARAARRYVQSSIAEDARRWIASAEQRTGSFLWICGLLDLNPDTVRARLEARGGGGT